MATLAFQLIFDVEVQIAQPYPLIGLAVTAAGRAHHGRSLVPLDLSSAVACVAYPTYLYLIVISEGHTGGSLLTLANSLQDRMLHIAGCWLSDSVLIEYKGHALSCHAR